MKRRNAIKSMIALACAPAIIKIEMIMPVKAIEVIPALNYDQLLKAMQDYWMKLLINDIYGTSNFIETLEFTEKGIKVIPYQDIYSYTDYTWWNSTIKKG